jgi:O-antigen ligase
MTHAVLVGSAAILAALAFIPCVRRPTRTILPLYTATLPIASVFTLHVPLPSKFNTLSSALGAVAILAVGLHIALYRRGRALRMQDAGWLLFLAWAAITPLWAIDPSGAFGILQVAWSLMVLLFVVAALPTDEADLDVLRVAMIVSGLLVGTYATYLILKGAPLPVHGVSRRFSIATTPTDTNPNILAAALIAPMVLSVEAILLGGSRWWSPWVWRALGAAGAFFSFVAIVFTASRGGLVSAAVAFVACVMLCWHVPEARVMLRRVVMAIVSVSLAVGLVLVIRPPGNQIGPLRDFLGNPSLKRITETDRSGSGRLDIWVTGYHACLQYCGWGVGFGNFPDVYDQVFAFSGAQSNVGANRPAHDIYLQVVVEDGFIGGALLVLALLLEWRALGFAHVRRVLPSAKAALVGILVANVFLSALWFKYFWIVFILFRVAQGSERPPVTAGEPVASPGTAT